MLGKYLEDEYIEGVLERSNNVISNFYYVQMANAWLIATAFAKYRDITLNFLHNTKIDNTTYNMAIRKMRESNRVSKEDKELVNTMKR